MTRDYSQFLPGAAQGRDALQPLSRLRALGWRPAFAQQTSVEELTRTPPVRVTEVHRNALQVAGEGIDTTIPPVDDVTVGDWLLLDQETGEAARILDRQSLIQRRAPGTELRMQLIAANIDTGFVVSSCNADFNVARLERYIALLFDAGITPVILLTKADLVDDTESFAEQARQISDRVEVVALDARSDEPGQKLRAWCRPGQTVAFLGSSGVGKSTLTNALIGGGDIETRAIREDDAKGRHTTTRRQLHLVPAGCAVLDTPGMRELQLADVADGIGAVFEDISEMAGQCRFNDCQHLTEPGCAVLAAIERGEVEPDRLARWRKLMTEDALNAASVAERRQKDRAFGKMIKGVIESKRRQRGSD